MSKGKLKRGLSHATATSALIVTAGISVPALAQIDEIIVTSQKREQSIQTLPISATAFDAAALEIKQIDNFSDLQFNTPNVTFTKTNFTGSNFSIRGIGSAAVAASGDGGVGIHINDAPMRSAALFETEYLDLERLEILRGPQGTLFGRNATGGVVNMITRKPTNEFELQTSISIGNYDHQKISAILNVPLTDSLAVRVAGLDLSRDGYTENIHTGNDIDGRDQYAVRGSVRWTPGDVTTIDFMYSYFEEESNRARVSKQLCHRDPTGILGCLPDKLAFETTNAWSTLGSILTSNEILGPALGWGSIFTDPDSFAGAVNPPDLRKVSADFDPIYAADEKLWTLQLEREMDNHTLTILGSQKNASSQTFTDYNWAVNDPVPVDPEALFLAIGQPINAALYAGGLPISAITSSDTGILGGNIKSVDAFPDAYDQSGGDSKQWTAEVRLRSDLDGEVNYLIGGLFMHTESYGSYHVVASSLDYASIALVAGVGDGFGLATPYFESETRVNELDAWAVFGEVYFDVNDDIRITTGLRLNNDEKTVSDRQTLFNTFVVQGADTDVLAAFNAALFDPDTNPAGTTPAYHEDTNDWQELTGRLLFEWSPDLGMTDETLIYGSYSRGYKGGGFNPPSFSGAISATFEPEFINAFEVGMKNTLWDNTLTANLSAFKYDYEGYQVSKIIDRSSSNENIDAEIWGFEAELVWVPNENWASNLTFSFLNTEIGDAGSIDSRDPTNGEAGYLLIKDLSNASHCVLDPGSMDIATAVAFLGAALPSGTVPIPGLASEGAFTTCDGVGAVIGLVDAAAPAGWTVGQASITGGNEADLSGNPLPNSPEWSFNVGTQRTFYTDAGYELTTRIDYYKQAEMFGRIYNRAVDKIEGWGMLNLSATLIAPDGVWEMKAFVQNALDDDNVTGHYFTDATSGNFTNVFILEPRLYGLTITSRF